MSEAASDTPSPQAKPIPREIRRLAFQALFQLDAHEGSDVNGVRRTLEEEAQVSAEKVEVAFKLALAAFADRHAADKAMERLAPAWPAHRQAAVDRAILRLAHYELTRKLTPGKLVVNDCVGLAQEFSTDKSPSFVNALLDKVYKSSGE
ncbi:MAG: transcription antitermination factor NusB [Phycisphaerales bacterium]|nr:transcription antitermination factor NusB [Phycisphaerales bacterium]